jgi:hypothetical protein
MRTRIYAAFGEVLSLKRRREADLRASVEFPRALLDRIVRLLADPGPEALTDDALYAPLAAEMARATTLLGRNR